LLLRTAVSVVTLFSWRATKPADLKRAVAIQDLAGTQTDDVIAEVSRRSPSTLAARGAHGLLFERGRNVAVRLDTPVGLEVTAGGEPRHPLYVAAGADPIPYLLR
jgi:hypothetical protein